MGLRCLLGHDFTPPEVERDREEDGNEVVVTVQEVKTCKRCGERQVVSENKEVTTIKTPDEVGLDEGAPTPADAESNEDAASEPASASAAATTDDAGSDAADEDEAGDLEPPADPDSEDAEILDEPDAERGHGEWPDAPAGRSEVGTESAADPPGDDGAAVVDADETDADGAGDDGTDDDDPVEDEPGASPVEDDGIPASEDAEFIDADEDTAEPSTPWPDHDEEPAADAAEPSDAGAWPEVDGDDEGYAAETASGTDPDVDFGGGLAPQAADGTSGYVGHDPEGDTGSDIVRAEPSGPAPRSDAATEFYCPNCGHAESAGASSMRAGDICPDCRKGYIAEREV